MGIKMLSLPIQRSPIMFGTVRPMIPTPFRMKMRSWVCVCVWNAEAIPGEGAKVEECEIETPEVEEHAYCEEQEGGF